MNHTKIASARAPASYERCTLAVHRTSRDYQAFRISPDDSNRLAIVFEPANAHASVTVCVEIFDPGGRTPPNRHFQAIEMFFVLKGEGIAMCDGKAVPLGAGHSILVPPTGLHQLINTGPGRLYALCIMVPNEDFAELIRSGIPAELDEEDLRVLGRCDVPIAC
ncbi:mannose-6-phosphate isomerase [Rubidibacter lacunae KORDI 51-2]|uniref:Mannose-6-phosphate isomerase n=1 Tax=Rubidibacter lacunae KORDI 51-2 TaxID=582515 RepID=U5DGJ6_9CHRO|nr:cupin domain-containing protein [Rubidibacter lacunae]ERN40726.1 mannose-6-phosphate isomerase [Rubidibacter lacunae KORDI 51-2]